MAHAKGDRIIVQNVGGMIEVIHHGPRRKDLKPKESEGCKNMEGTKNLSF